VLALVDGRLLLASSGNLPWKTIAELVTYAKANPGKLNYGASSPVSRLAMALLTKEVGIDAVFVPYNGSGPYSQALAVGEVHMGFVTDAQAAALKLQVLALTGQQRSPAYPDTPTFAEIGHPRIQGLTYSLRVRSGTPKLAMDKLSAAAARALQNAEVKAQLGKVRLTIVEEAPEVTSRRLLESAKIIGSIAASSGMQPQ